MYSCPSCGAVLTFDIASQHLACGYCDFRISPDQINRQEGVDEEFETNILTCTQCGGEIYTLDRDLTGFCSYCGANMTFSSRLQKMERPKRIIPFTRTKEDCKNAYMKAVKGAVFAPKAFKQEKFIDGFRGIYMPYWKYEAELKNDFKLKGTKDYTLGKYDYHEEYDLEATLDMNYPDLIHDASRTFSDDISERIEPYLMDQTVDFSTAYLCGFYGEIQDVNSDEYLPYINHIVEEDGFEAAKQNWSEISVTKPSDLGEVFRTRIRDKSLILLPVWFLSYRNKDRVTYATVNGQTGKTSAMIPIDAKKYLLATLLLTLPLWLLLNLFLSVRPETLLVLTTMFGLFGSLVYRSALMRLVRSNAEFDLNALDTLKENDLETIQSLQNKRPSRMSAGEMVWLALFLIGLFVMVLIQVIDSELYADITYILNMRFMLIVEVLVFMVLSLITLLSARHYYGLGKKLHMPVRPAWIGGMVSMILCTVVEIIHPVSDLYFYGAGVLALLFLAFMLLDLIHCHNASASRPLPQFEHMGGEDLA